MGGCVGLQPHPCFNGTAEAIVGAWEGFKPCLDAKHQ